MNHFFYMIGALIDVSVYLQSKTRMQYISELFEDFSHVSRSKVHSHIPFWDGFSTSLNLVASARTHIIFEKNVEIIYIISR